MSAGGKSGRGGPSDGSREDDPKALEREESFADLIGDAKPLAGRRKRIAPPISGPKSSLSKNRKRATGEGATDSSHGPFRHPDPEQSRLGAAPGVSDAQLNALMRGEIEPEERIDLHGLRKDAARKILPKRLASARAQGLGCVAVIHGQGLRSDTGEAILRDALPSWLGDRASRAHVNAFAPAPNRLGGGGVTLVLLKRR